jgi:3-oxoacyl-[acyl-carrier protein] reductase
MHVKGKTALVTGASRGIGAAIARTLAAEGAAVAVNYHHSEGPAREVVADILKAGGRAIALQGDARNPSELSAVTERVKAELGPIDVFVLNASISFPVKGFLEYPWEAFEAKLLGEMGAAFHGCRAVLPQMIEQKGGSIVAITSGLARTPGFGFCAHSAAKAALEGFVRALALELGPMGIQVNAVAPGLTLTDATAFLPEAHKQATAEHTPLRRNGKPQDVAEAVLGILRSGFVTGTTLPVNGGIQVN